jgi:hypothetical protein
MTPAPTRLAATRGDFPYGGSKARAIARALRVLCRSLPSAWIQKEGEPNQVLFQEMAQLREQMARLTEQFDRESPGGSVIPPEGRCRAIPQPDGYMGREPW